MDEQPTCPVDLLELLDLEERELLARDLNLLLPTSLSDSAFRESIAGFS